MNQAEAARQQQILRDFAAKYRGMKTENLALKSQVLTLQAGELAWAERERDFAQMIEAKDAQVTVLQGEKITLQDKLEAAMAAPEASAAELEAEQKLRKQLEAELEASQAVAEKSEADRKVAEEALAATAEQVKELEIQQEALQAEIAEDAAADKVVSDELGELERIAAEETPA